MGRAAIFCALKCPQPQGTGNKESVASRRIIDALTCYALFVSTNHVEQRTQKKARTKERPNTARITPCHLSHHKSTAHYKNFAPPAPSIPFVASSPYNAFYALSNAKNPTKLKISPLSPNIWKPSPVKFTLEFKRRYIRSIYNVDYFVYSVIYDRYITESRAF